MKQAVTALVRDALAKENRRQEKAGPRAGFS
jgi:hypothetical protein